METWLLLVLGLPVCSHDFWEMYTEVLCPGGTPATPASSRYDCRALCEVDVTCLAFNWNSVGSVCEIFSNSTSIAPITSLSASSTGTHYRRCDVVPGT